MSSRNAMHIVEVGGDGTPSFSPQNWDEIAVAIRALDGESKPTLFLVKPNEEYFSIMATADGLYSCGVYGDAIGEFALISPGESRELVKVYLNEVERRAMVDLDTALKAARTYAERGERDSSLTWEEY